MRRECAFFHEVYLSINELKEKLFETRTGATAKQVELQILERDTHSLPPLPPQDTPTFCPHRQTQQVSSL